MAGLAGGLAEVAWVGVYAGASGGNGFGIARHVADTVFPGVLAAPFAPALGLAIHFSLSLALGVVMVGPLAALARRSMASLLPAALGMLGLIWAMNFLLVLPSLNPIFPTLLPFAVSLTSKLLFGAAFAGVLATQVRSPFARTGGSPASRYAVVRSSVGTPR